MFVVAMVMRYSQACHVHRSAAATRSRHTRTLSFWPAPGIHSAVSPSERKSLWKRSIRAGPTSPSSFLCHRRAIAGLLSLKWPWISMNSLIHKHCQKRCKGSTEPRGSKRGLVLNLCLLNLEMTSSVRYNLILTEQIQSGWPAPTCRRLSTMTGDWERGGRSLCGLSEKQTQTCVGTFHHE